MGSYSRSFLSMSRAVSGGGPLGLELEEPEPDVGAPIVGGDAEGIKELEFELVVVL